ncbi:MAG: isoleucine--tRNA ligase, partial [Nitrospirae bacterium]|nr:isoleucine--tRNA ligase [Candidatus Troglogloeales bacterium]
MKKYQGTLNLPKTDFPMRANLKEKEIALLAKWDQDGLYKKIQENREGAEKYILHDGHPYANGHIHIGHALNKILKDIIVKSKTMMGYSAPYVPGWDCHGLPIEYEVLKEARSKKETLSSTEIRRRCRVYAQKFVNIQREEFKRLGVLGDWENPYLTMTPDYEADIVREFGKVVESDGVYKAKKPVLWCPYDETALAEAEVEYADHTSPAIYVKFKINMRSLAAQQILGENVVDPYLIIWTTTPWTLAANQAICLHPKFDYQIVQVDRGKAFPQTWIIAKELVEPCVKKFDEVTDHKVLKTCKGADLKPLRYFSPFIYLPNLDTPSYPVVLGEHVTLEQGTGCVHTAPGHGREDYQVGMEYDLKVFAPVDSRGRFTTEIEILPDSLPGIEVHKGNDSIIAALKGNYALVKEEKIEHPYPHCWRCKKPVIFRATEQWFISMSGQNLREQAINAIETKVKWIPEWGKDRILGMMKNRPDWCISRQRSWGVPIVAFSCTSCGKLLYNKIIINHVAKQMETGGADIWFSKSANELLPEGTICTDCGGVAFNKENDILDVWFESGVSHAAVLERRPELAWPADLYLEGSDQHRGWFHSSLLASLSSGKGCAPYATVLTHGFTVDGAGKKMSKSSGNVVVPQEIIDKHGAEILRLWVAAT